MGIEELKKEEKRLFDTYKQNKSNKDKVKHLREMANVIDLLESLTNSSLKNVKSKNFKK
jgi:hypothetical protein